MFFTTGISSCLMKKFKTALVWSDSWVLGWEAWAKMQSRDCLRAEPDRAGREALRLLKGIRIPLPAWRWENPGRGLSDLPRVTL